MKKPLLYIFGIALVIASILVFAKINNNSNKKRVNPAFKKYIVAYTAGVISTESTIKICLSEEIGDSSAFNNVKLNSLFSFSPSIEGNAKWLDAKTIEFCPKEKLPANENYDAVFYLGKLTKVPDSLSDFEFQFKTMKQNCSLIVDNHKAYNSNDLSKEKMIGKIETADVADITLVEKAFTANQGDKKLPVKWEHSLDRKIHTFTVDSIARGTEMSYVEIVFDGSDINADGEIKKSIEIHPVNQFTLLSVQVEQYPELHVRIQFTDPLMPDQDLTGLIRLGNFSNLTFSIEDNLILVYPSSEITGDVKISIQNIKNINGKVLQGIYNNSIFIDKLAPEVRLLGNGVIVPSSNGIIFPFEAVNLMAVDVKITKIYQTNILQFLQVNDLEGSSELARVGKTIYKDKVSLKSETVTDFSRWNKFTLDLSELVKTEPGALYRVTINFKKEYSLYTCEGEAVVKDEALKEVSDIDEDEDISSYENGYYYDYEGEYYEYDEDYNWDERDNPCSSSYYRDKKISRNVLASDLGLIAKKTNENHLQCIVTNLINAAPQSDAKVELFDFQQQLLMTGTTNSDGIIDFELGKKKPYFVIAKSGENTSYIKLVDGKALNMSMFDVGGEEVKNGLKGFIYGERGVWRPGDSIYLTFILQKDNKLPGNHPVIFKLQNPMGQVVQQMVKTKAVDGFYDFRTCTEPSAVTGNWTAKFTIGGSEFSKIIKIETIKPNRLKINIDFGGNRILSTSQKITKLNAVWLHGGIASNLKTDVNVHLSKSDVAFKGYDMYTFNDPSSNFMPQNFTIFTGQLDEKGNAEFPFELKQIENAPGVLNASVETRVFEESGNFSIDRTTVPLYAFDSYVGIAVPEVSGKKQVLETDVNHTLQLVTLNPDGRPTSKKLQVDIYKVNWRWWWDNSNDNLADYLADEYNSSVYSETVFTANGKGTCKFKIDYPEWGRYLIRVKDIEGGHVAGKIVTVDWPYGSNKSHGGQESVTMLSFTADKDKYIVGEKVNLTIPSAKDGKVMISIENGTRVVKTFWQDTDDKFTKVAFDVTSEMSPNIFVNIMLLQKHNQTKNDLPIRMYGAIPLMIENPETHLYPVISCLDVFKPEQKATVRVSEKSGKAMTYTLAIVDDGLLDLTRYKTPNPFDYFYAKEALGVKTWDVFDLVLGAFGGKLERILAIGGDDDAGKKGKSRANRFKPMVRFIGPYTLKKGQSVNHVIDIPQYVGSARIMVVAGKDKAYGSAEKTVAIRKPVMILATLPRVLGPSEIVKLPVNVFALENNVRKVNVSVSANAMFEVVGSASKVVEFSKAGDKIVEFELRVKDVVGVGKVKVLAKTTNDKSEENIEIDIRNPNLKQYKVIESIVEAGKMKNISFSPVGIVGTNKGTIEVSSMPPINLEKRLRYLLTYPHGCIEQTTSSAFPQLYLADILELAPAVKAKTEANIKAAINRLKQFQVANGGMSYWPGNSYTDEWGTCYAGHFMLEASAKGYTLPNGFLDAWKKYQKQQANIWSPNSSWTNNDLIQAYRLYTLALAGAPHWSAMNRLRELKNISLYAKWRLAAAYQLAGKGEIAADIVNKLAKTEKLDANYYDYTYGSVERDDAMVIEALTLMGRKTDAWIMIKKLSVSLSRDYWMSTQTTAYSLMAISKYFKTEKISSQMLYTYILNGGKKVDVNNARKIAQHEVSVMDIKKNGKLNFTNRSKGILYMRLILEGIPATGQETEASSNLKMAVVYKDMKGNTINTDRMVQGTDFYAEITVQNTGTRGMYKDLALSTIFASGWEIKNDRLWDGVTSQTVNYSYRDIRDDRVYTYFDLTNNESKTFRISLNASYLGKFYLPATTCDAMYDNSVYARNKGKWIEIVKDGGTVIAAR
ncbi:MAG: MG2 domain-containing protein [Bacteroidota bacterium]